MTMIKKAPQPLFLALIILCAISTKTYATNSEPSLKITPDRCISLHKGQTCYQKVTIRWKAPTKADYCLFHKEMNSPLQCWKASRNGLFEMDFKSDKSIEFELRQKGEHSPIATSSLSIHWVYKSTKRQKRGWRLF